MKQHTEKYAKNSEKNFSGLGGLKGNSFDYHHPQNYFFRTASSSSIIFDTVVANQLASCIFRMSFCMRPFAVLNFANGFLCRLSFRFQSLYPIYSCLVV
jgi:hypothetical protein